MTNFLPDLRFLPEGLTSVTSATPINDGITLGTFMRGVTLDHIPELSDRIQLVRNLLPHAEILKVIRDNDTRFSEYQLVVAEGIYKPAPEETVTESEDNHNFLAQTGRAIAYELRKNGVPDNDKTVELARYLNVFLPHFDKLIIDYDTYVGGEINAQILVHTPTIPANYQVTFKRKTETVYNNNIQAQGQIVEVSDRPPSAITFPAQLPDQVAGFFCVGDIHARLLRTFGGDPWQSYARDGRMSRDTVIIENINRIKKGEVVVVSAGYNDTSRTNATPDEIAAKVKTILQASIARKHVISFLLFPRTTTVVQSRSDAVRNALVEVCNNLPEISIVDLGDTSQFSMAVDGETLTAASYIKISDGII